MFFKEGVDVIKYGWLSNRI